MKEIKTGRKVTSIDFIVKDNDKRKYFNEENKKIKSNEKNKVKDLKFNNFEQRNYDYDDLEKKLLGWDKD